MKRGAKMNETKTNINWYPGHMTKTKRKMQESLKLVDAVAEIVDARLPLSSRNPDFDNMFSNKPRVIILNKCDIANPEKTKNWTEFYKKQNFVVLTTDCKNNKGSKSFIPLVKDLLKEKIEKNKKRGLINKSVRVMIVGIPNVGKSSFINNLVKGRKAKVEDRPGVTRGNQWFTLDQNVELLDTPGVLWPKFDDQTVAQKLAFCGAIKDQVVDIEDLASNFLIFLKSKYKQNLMDRYKLEKEFLDDENLVGYEILKEIAKKRGMLLSKGEVNTERAAETVLDEFRAAKLGRITLDEVPEDFSNTNKNL